MNRFRTKALHALLEARKPHITLSAYQHITKVVDRGAEGIDIYELANLCRDLGCLPHEIIEYV